MFSSRIVSHAVRIEELLVNPSTSFNSTSLICSLKSDKSFGGFTANFSRTYCVLHLIVRLCAAHKRDLSILFLMRRMQSRNYGICIRIFMADNIYFIFLSTHIFLLSLSSSNINNLKRFYAYR